MDRRDSFSALKTFQRFLRLKPTSHSVDQVKVAVAEAYLNLDRYPDAVGSLEDVEQSAKDPQVGIEAAFRMGDVYFRKKDYAEAVKQYKAAEKEISRFHQRFSPNAAYNQAEAQFWLANYRQALDGYRHFLELFPDHPHGGFAMTQNWRDHGDSLVPLPNA